MRVVTLNCFLNARWLTAGIRLRLIARELGLMAPDVILLQEVIIKRYRRWLERYLRSLGYRCFSEDGPWFTRGGLLTAVRSTITKAKFHLFHNQGGLVGLLDGDAIMGKGYQRLEVTIGKKRLTLINTHLLSHCGISRRRDINSNLADQVAELRKAILNESKESNLLIAGDFNFPPDSRFYREVTKDTNLKDVMSERTSFNGNDKRYATHSDGRLDYIFYRGNELGHTKSALVFRTPLTMGGSHHSLSDHLGVMCEFG